MILRYLGKIFFILFLSSSLHGAIEFKQSISKSKIYLNETIKVTLTLKFDNSENIDQVYFEEYDTYQFWLEQFGDEVIIKSKETTTYQYQFLLDPKKVGNFTLSEQLIKISSAEIRRFKRWKKISSNENILEVSPLYNGLKIQGNYSIDLEVSKEKIKPNEGISVTLILKGEGNLKDIQKFVLPLKDQIVYSEKPIVTQEFVGSGYKGELVQKFFIIANKDFTIPTVTFEFYNPKLKVVQKISTKPYYIEVQQIAKNSGDHYSLKYIFAFIGVVFGYFFYKLLKLLKVKKRQQQLPIIKQIKQAKNDKELYRILIANYSNNKEFENSIKLLEENIYNEMNHNVEKKKIFKMIYKLDNS